MRNWRIVLAQMHATRLRLASAASAMSNLTGASDLSRATTSDAGGVLGHLSAEADKLLQMAMFLVEDLQGGPRTTHRHINRKGTVLEFNQKRMQRR